MKYIHSLNVAALCIFLLVSVNACAEFQTRLDEESIMKIRDAVGTTASEATDIVLTGDTTLTEESAEKITDGVSSAVIMAVEAGLGATGMPFDLSPFEGILGSLLIGFLSRMGYVKVKNSKPGHLFGPGD